jgi:hypothetical protein
MVAADSGLASLAIFAGQVGVAIAILLAIFGSDIPRLLPLVIPAGYLLSSKIAGEHSILTELLGFTLLSLAAVLVKFLLTNGLDVRLFHRCYALFYRRRVQDQGCPVK